jgi:hypothetical protein
LQYNSKERTLRLEETKSNEVDMYLEVRKPTNLKPLCAAEAQALLLARLLRRHGKKAGVVNLEQSVVVGGFFGRNTLHIFSVAGRGTVKIIAESGDAIYVTGFRR